MTALLEPVEEAPAVPMRRWIAEELDHRTPRVAAEIVEVQRAAYRIEAELIAFDGMPGLHETADDVAALGLRVLGVRDHGTLVGLVGYAIDGAVVDLDRLTVAPSHFRLGIATTLLDALHVAEPGRAVEVMTGTWNLPAVALYERHGYRCVETRLSQGCWISCFARPAIDLIPR